MHSIASLRPYTGKAMFARNRHAAKKHSPKNRILYIKTSRRVPKIAKKEGGGLFLSAGIREKPCTRNHGGQRKQSVFSRPTANSFAAEGRSAQPASEPDGNIIIHR